jgi:hypothetical protein
MKTATVESPVLDLLAWLASRPRSYAETMEAWRTSCPSLSVWEDALDAGLVRVVRSGDGKPPEVTLTTRGRGALSS